MSNAFISQCKITDNTILTVNQHYIIKQHDTNNNLYSTWVELGQDEFMLLTFSEEEFKRRFICKTPIIGDDLEPNSNSRPTDEECLEAESHGYTLVYYSGVRLFVEMCMACDEWFAKTAKELNTNFCDNCNNK